MSEFVCSCLSCESVFPNFCVYELQYFGVTKDVKRFEERYVERMCSHCKSSELEPVTVLPGECPPQSWTV